MKHRILDIFIICAPNRKCNSIPEAVMASITFQNFEILIFLDQLRTFNVFLI